MIKSNLYSIWSGFNIHFLLIFQGGCCPAPSGLSNLVWPKLRLRRSINLISLYLWVNSNIRLLYLFTLLWRVTYICLKNVYVVHGTLERWNCVALCGFSPPLPYMVRSTPVRSSEREEAAAVTPLVVDVFGDRKRQVVLAKQTETHESFINKRVKCFQRRDATFYLIC